VNRQTPISRLDLEVLNDAAIEGQTSRRILSIVKPREERATQNLI